MSLLYLIGRLFLPSWNDNVFHDIVNALLLISDALWVVVISKILGWW